MCRKCSVVNRRGPRSHAWKGGRHVDAQGYVRVYVREHPRSDSYGYVKEHTVVMEGILGRPLYDGENVHHLNGVKADNRADNLELWVRTQPSGQRPKDLVVWANEILRRYATSAETPR